MEIYVVAHEDESKQPEKAVAFYTQVAARRYASLMNEVSRREEMKFCADLMSQDEDDEEFDWQWRKPYFVTPIQLYESVSLAKMDLKD